MDEPMTDARLDEISALADAATPGPWEQRIDNRRGTQMPAQAYLIKPPKPGSNIPQTSCWRLDDLANLAFVAAARTAVDELVAEVRRLREANALLRAGTSERSTLLESARDALSAAGITQAHGGGTWPRIDDSIEELAKQRDDARAELAAKEA